MLIESIVQKIIIICNWKYIPYILKYMNSKDKGHNMKEGQKLQGMENLSSKENLRKKNKNKEEQKK